MWTMLFKLEMISLLCGLIFLAPAGCFRQSSPDPASASAAAQDKIIKDSLTGMSFVWIPAGCYQMGQTEAEKTELIASLGQAQYRQWFVKELPRHRVCVDGFWMGQYEVTVAEFEQFLHATGYCPTAMKRDWSWCMTDRFERKTGVNHCRPGFEQDDRHPVVHVSWIDARAMADWLTDNSDGAFRLPTEAEWELACRAGTGTARFWGQTTQDACLYANGHDRTSVAERGFSWPPHDCRDGFAQTAPVGSFKPNAFGLYDMLGNVSEWCRDAFSDDAYSRHKPDNPVYTREGGMRVVRGGGWYSSPADMRCAVRRGNCPMNTDDALGFRLVMAQ
jgi:formylglycine-generating enzyme required for sulfatase activity